MTFPVWSLSQQEYEKLNRAQKNRYDFLKSVCEDIENGELEKAEFRIKEEAAIWGYRKRDWKTAILDFMRNRTEWPAQQEWALRQWTIAANYSIK